MFGNIFRKNNRFVDKLSPLEAYLSFGINKVEGWLLQDAIDLLLLLNVTQTNNNITGNLGEIGVWQGKLLILFCLLANSSEKVIGVDSFVHCTPPTLCEEKFAKNISLYAPDFNRLTLIKSDSKLLSLDDIRCNSNGYRFFDVDGDHTAEGAYHDLVLASKAINSGGIILIDDYFNDTCPGVSEGVCKFFFENCNSGLAPFAICGNKLFVTTDEYYDLYFSVILDQLVNNNNLLYKKSLDFHNLHKNLNIKLKMFGKEVIVLKSN